MVKPGGAFCVQLQGCSRASDSAQVERDLCGLNCCFSSTELTLLILSGSSGSRQDCSIFHGPEAGPACPMGLDLVIMMAYLSLSVVLVP